MIEGQAEMISEAEKVLQTCEQLFQAGFLDNKIYTVDQSDIVENAKFQSKKLCDQTTSGGGWTVAANTALIVVFACLLVLCCHV